FPAYFFAFTVIFALFYRVMSNDFCVCTRQAGARLLIMCAFIFETLVIFTGLAVETSLLRLFE
ncbi:hypothetical protein, partial [Vibrio brasiliensis]